MGDDLFPVEWAGRRAIVTFPGRVDVSNVGQLRDRLHFRDQPRARPS